MNEIKALLGPANKRHPHNQFNGAKQEAAATRPQPKTEHRWSTAAAYLHGKARPNLTIRTRPATRILFDGNKATGVEFHTPKGPETACAGREVIVSGGARLPQFCNCPALVRPAHTDLGISGPTSSVGANLQDHFNTYCTYRISKNLQTPTLCNTAYPTASSPAPSLFCSGQMSGNGALRQRPGPRSAPGQPDLQFSIPAGAPSTAPPMDHFPSIPRHLHRPVPRARSGAPFASR
jgi:choline dehydrogenase